MWILILYIYAGPLCRGDSVALTDIANFKSEQECIAAGKKAFKLVESSCKEEKFVCLNLS